MMDADNGMSEPTALAGNRANVEEERMSIGRYLWTRLPTLKPPMNKSPNPISLLAQLNREQWLFFLVCTLQ